MRGSVVKRGRRWSYVVDIGRDPANGRRRQRWKGGFVTRREAERALARVLGGADGADAVAAGALTLGAFLDQWLAGATPTLKPTTLKSKRGTLGNERVQRLEAVDGWTWSPPRGPVPRRARRLS